MSSASRRPLISPPVQMMTLRIAVDFAHDLYLAVLFLFVGLVDADLVEPKIFT